MADRVLDDIIVILRQGWCSSNTERRADRVLDDIIVILRQGCYSSRLERRADRILDDGNTSVRVIMI